MDENQATERMPGAGFEPAKQYAEELESTPFDHSGTPASVLPVKPILLDYSSCEMSTMSQGFGGGRRKETTGRIRSKW